MLVLLGIASELYQLGAPGRRPRLSDALLNGIAAVGAMLVYRKVSGTGRPLGATEANGGAPGGESRVEGGANKGEGTTELRPPGGNDVA